VVEVDGVLWGQRWWHAPGEAVEIQGEVVEATACFGGEAVKGALPWRRRALGIGGVEHLKHVSGKKLLSVELAARAPDIYIGGQMRDVHSLRRIAHFSRRVVHYF
jgi:hypothetical protein